MIQQAAVFGVVWLASLAGAGWWAYQQGRDHELASQYREQVAGERAAQAATDAAVAAISKIEVKHVTLRQQLEREVQVREVFRDCRSGDVARRVLNASPAIDGRAGAELPTATPAQ